MEFAEIEEAGLRFEIQGPFDDGRYLTMVRSSDAVPRAFGSEDLAAVGGLVDRLVAAQSAYDRFEAFEGIDIEVYDHEDGIVRRKAFPTRGALLQWFSDGRVPTSEEAAELAEFTGDTVLAVRDASGRMLLDQRRSGAERIAALASAPPGP